jgi:hypothetical protein
VTSSDYFCPARDVAIESGDAFRSDIAFLAGGPGDRSLQVSFRHRLIVDPFPVGLSSGALIAECSYKNEARRFASLSFSG